MHTYLLLYHLHSTHTFVRAWFFQEQSLDLNLVDKNISPDVAEGCERMLTYAVVCYMQVRAFKSSPSTSTSSTRSTSRTRMMKIKSNSLHGIHKHTHTHTHTQTHTYTHTLFIFTFHLHTHTHTHTVFICTRTLKRWHLLLAENAQFQSSKVS